MKLVDVVVLNAIARGAADRVIEAAKPPLPDMFELLQKNLQSLAYVQRLDAAIDTVRRQNATTMPSERLEEALTIIRSELMQR